MIFSISPSTLCFTIHFWWFLMKNTKKIQFCLLWRKNSISPNSLYLCCLEWCFGTPFWDLCCIFDQKWKTASALKRSWYSDLLTFGWDEKTRTEQPTPSPNTTIQMTILSWIVFRLWDEITKDLCFESTRNNFQLDSPDQ